MRTLRLATLFACLLATACSNKEEPAPVAHMPALNLGKPGETVGSAEMNPKANTHVLEKNEHIKFVDDQGKVEILHKRGRRFREGDIVMGNEKQRILLKVKKVEYTGVASSVLITKLGGMTDLLHPDKNSVVKVETTPKLESSDLNAAPKGDPNKPSRFEVDKDGRIIMENVELMSLNFDDKGGLKIGLNQILGVPVVDPHEKLDISAVAAGRYRAVINQAVMQVIPTFRNNYKWNGLRPQELHSRIDAQLKYRMDVTFEASGKAEFTALMDLFKKKVIPVRIPSAVPVYVDIEMGIPLGVTFKSEAEGSVRVIYEAEYAFTSELRYTEADGLKTTGDQGAKILHHEIIADTSAQFSLTGEIFLQPMVEARFYRVLGPNTYLQPYVRAEWQTPAQAGKDDLFVGVGGGVGLQVSEPILLNHLFSLDSGRIFDFSTSWDLVGGSNPKPEAFPYLVSEGQTLNKLTPEGYVVLDFSSKALPAGTRFTLSRSSQSGYVVPSQRFFLDGKLFYYPTIKADEDNLEITFLLPDGTKDRREIKLTIGDEIKAEAGKERFSQSSNSVKAAYGHPQQFQDKVPHHGFVFGGIRAAPIREDLEPELKEAVLKNGHMIFGENRNLNFLVAQEMNQKRMNSHKIFFDEAFLEEFIYATDEKNPEQIDCGYRLKSIEGREDTFEIQVAREDLTCALLTLGVDAEFSLYNEKEERVTVMARPMIHHVARVMPDGSFEELELEKTVYSRKGWALPSIRFRAPKGASEYILYFTPNPAWKKGFVFAPSVRLKSPQYGNSPQVDEDIRAVPRFSP